MDTREKAMLGIIISLFVIGVTFMIILRLKNPWWNTTLRILIILIVVLLAVLIIYTFIYESDARKCEKQRYHHFCTGYMCSDGNAPTGCKHSS